MADFDLASLLAFQPPRWLCEKCLALIREEPSRRAPGGKVIPLRCPVCKVEYVPTDEYRSVGRYLTGITRGIEFEDIIGHSTSLAILAEQARKKSETPPLYFLLAALAQAQQFIHFSTFGISLMLIGALKLVAQRVPVRGIVSNADPHALAELKEEDAGPRLDVHVYGREATWRDMPHQKLVVVDGLLAFKGSANLTTNAWRNAGKGLDIVEPLTNVGEVIDLHNRYFSPVWASFSKIGDRIEMNDDIPF
ncbi:MAG: hypothetical protein DMG27_02745 [Acidobacteria bacterium]|nr:MAG: hypothetical protein DMG27_02745 [Acidobacteriota bacterium]